MSKNKSGKKKQGIKHENNSVEPDVFKYRSFSDIYPLSRPQVRENHSELKENTPQKDKKKEDCYDLNQEFLFALIQPIFLLDKQKMQNTITRLIFNSELIKKLEGDLEKKETLNSSMNIFIKNLIFRHFEKDSILYRTGEEDNNFYFVIKGRISALKPKRINKEISLDDYILYLIQLKQKQEMFLLNKTLKLNNNSVPIKSINDIKKINTIIFKKRLEQLINSENSEILSDNNDLESFFKEYYQDFNYYNISKKDLKKFLSLRGKILSGVLNREWDDYILERCKLSTDENLFFEPFEAVFKENKHNFLCYTYEYNEEYINSDYFGDFSLDEDKVIRNETVRFEEDTTIAFIGVEEYIDIISPQKKIEKKNDIMRLNNSFCFKEISERIFKRNYYDMFIKKHCSKNSIIFNPDTKSNSLIFIKKGKLALELNCSIIDLQNLLKLIFDKLNDIPLQFDSYQKKILSKEQLKGLEFKYLSDPIFFNMKSHDKLFKIELEKKRYFQISLFSDFEVVGLEEVYLQIPHYAKAIVIGEKFIFNELSISKFNTILKNEMRLIKESYVQVSINRILSLMKRLNDIKENCIGMAKLRTNIDSSNVEKIPKEINVEYNFDISNKRKLNINNNRTTIPQINLANKSTNNNNKTEENNIKAFYKKNKINSTKRKTKLNSAHYVKSAKKMRNKKLTLEINENNKERAKSGKFEENLNKNEEEDENKKIKKKTSNIIIVGNRKINIKHLRREINEINLITETDENIKTVKKTIDNLFDQKESNLLEHNYQFDYENQKSINIDSNRKKNISFKKPTKENLSIQITDNEIFQKQRNIDSLQNMSNVQRINKYSHQINQFIPMSISPINPKIFHNKKSIYLNLLSQNNINENDSKIIQTLKNKEEQENSKLNILPKIEPKIRLDKYLNNSPNSNSIINNSNRNRFNGRIPDIVKNFYLEKKQKGCIPLIVNKRSNTIFLRKYHKKYNEN